MKFELDYKTGMMKPQKNEQIYFAKSQGGGLRIDDRKNNITYIIERDESITGIFGVRGADGLHIYDMKDARMIANRVLGMFGRNNKYSDYRYFLKGYRNNESIVKNFDDFVNEGMFSGIIRRSAGDDIKTEDKGNIDEINPIDIGTNVLWADKDFEYNGEYIFSYDEMKELHFSKGWRLPTKDESSDFLDHRESWRWKEVKKVIAIEYNNAEVCFDVSDHVDKYFIDDMEQQRCFTFSAAGFYFSPAPITHINSKCKIRLVKDK